MELSGFQVDAVASALERLQAEVPARTVLVLATGTGKTLCAIKCLLYFLRRYPGKRVLWVVGRRILVRQAAAEIRREEPTLRVGVEMALSRGLLDGPFADQVIVASVESIRRKDRLERFVPDAFSLLVVDECHHGIGHQGYHDLYRHFQALPRLGLTASPFDAAGNGLGDWWDSIAFEYGLSAAIAGGDLVSLRARSVELEEVDLSGIDFDKGELDEATIKRVESEYMQEEVLHKVAAVILKEVARPAIVYCVSVAHSAALASVLNRYEAGSARHIDCYQDERDKAQFERDFLDGKISFACNYALLYEGVDWKICAASVFCAKTNRVRYLQGIGRSTRFCCYSLRRDGVCSCGRNKTSAEVWDFLGNADEHDVSGIWAALAPGASAEELEAMERAAKEEEEEEGERRPAERIAYEVQALAAAVGARAVDVQFRAVDVELLDPLDEVRRRASLVGWRLPSASGALATEAQAARVADLIFFAHETRLREGPWRRALTAGQADALIKGAGDRARRGLALPLGLVALSRATTEQGGARVPRFASEVLRTLTADRARALVDELAKGWKR